MTLSKEDIANLAKYLVANHREELKGEEGRVGIDGQDGGVDYDLRIQVAQLGGELSILKTYVFTMGTEITTLKNEVASLKVELAKKF
jgi:hypothetical protein